MRFRLRDKNEILFYLSEREAKRYGLSSANLIQDEIPTKIEPSQSWTIKINGKELDITAESMDDPQLYVKKVESSGKQVVIKKARPIDKYDVYRAVISSLEP